MKIGVIGANGFIGSAVMRELHDRNLQAMSITHGSYHHMKNSEYDVIVNANGNSRKYWAENHPLEDFEKSVISVYKTMFDFEFKKYIYISSIDVHKPGIYGMHKRLGEEIVKCYCNNYVVVRPGTVIGKNMKKGVMKDIIDEKDLFVTPDSALQVITDFEIAKLTYHIIEKNIMNVEINAFSPDAISITELGKMLEKDLKIHTQAQYQFYFETPSDVWLFKKASEYVEATMLYI